MFLNKYKKQIKCDGCKVVSIVTIKYLYLSISHALIRKLSLISGHTYECSTNSQNSPLCTKYFDCRVVKPAQYLQEHSLICTVTTPQVCTAFSDACVHPFFSSRLIQLGREFLQGKKRFTRRDIVGLFGTQEMENVSLNPFWQVKLKGVAR